MADATNSDPRNARPVYRLVPYRYVVAGWAVLATLVFPVAAWVIKCTFESKAQRANHHERIEQLETDARENRDSHAKIMVTLGRIESKVETWHSGQ